MGAEKERFLSWKDFSAEKYPASMLCFRNWPQVQRFAKKRPTQILYYMIDLRTMALHKIFIFFKQVFRRYLVKSSALSAAAALSCSNAACHSRGGGVDRTGWWGAAAAGFRAWLNTPPLKYVIRLWMSSLKQRECPMDQITNSLQS